ncbi:protein EXORDIUM-like 7 [Physcomitrium patens]|uniref:Uncharacterized protein n=1 Tax=Physcomitrium patens TaxID=3218 RepID=A0A2K1JBK9_PHYPA|nr:protein EXORDIUM-like 7 [Physcomitrium patens]PNR38891.1 hypothetical protein PHYPA_019169 [Physcomitrium patens]|eukprot:XP_024396418.1 protein EXORDIUM-like 7 [Physcomitrella patens]
MASYASHRRHVSGILLAAMSICVFARGAAFAIGNKDPASSSSFPSALYHPFRPWPTAATDTVSKVLVKDPIVDIQYHMGPVLTSAIRVYIIWYGAWKISQKSIIRDFLASISAPASVPCPSVRQWWSTVQTYTDQTGANISASIVVAGEHEDRNYSHGKLLSRLSVQEVIRSALAENQGTLPVNTKGGLYMVLTSEDVMMQDYCRAVCGFHYFTFPAKVGYTLPYAWIGNSGKSCPEVCAFPFAIPAFMGESFAPLKSPNNDIGVDGMVSVIGHELAEISSNPLINAWYAGKDPSAPFEIADLCEGMYGYGAGGGYPGDVPTSTYGASYNVHGVRGRKFLVQWLWNADMNSCQGPV